MALKILDDSMSSDRSPHTARLLSSEHHTWGVSWLPGRRLNRNQAITALTVTELLAVGRTSSDPLVKALKAELR